jgi:phosphotransferase system HPr-like phosphotransfer protein
MSLLIDLKYTNLISPRFEKFVKKEQYLFNCRCPLCGDSKTNKSKMRGYIYRKGNDLFYRCHNCSAGLSLGNLIKSISPDIYKQYTLERYSSGKTNNFSSNNIIKIEPPKFDKVIKMKTFEHAEWCDKLPEQHFCVEYLTKRKIPKKYWNKLLFTKNYKEFINALIPDNEKTLYEDARLVIPFYNEYDELIAVTGRALESGDKTIRYITLRTVESDKKLIYGMDRLDLTKPVRIVEGQFDSLFLENAVASCDANLVHTAKEISSADKVLIFDNEPRNKEIVNLMQTAINKGNKVVIWPDTVKGKDINEMVMDRLSKAEIERIISSNTFSGLQAQTKFVYWKKV